MPAASPLLPCLTLLLALHPLAQDMPAPPPSPLPGLTYSQPFLPGSSYLSKVPSPATVLGFPVGSRPATCPQIVSVFGSLAAHSPRCRLVHYVTNHEGRPLHFLVIASESNLADLEALKADWAKLADPRELPPEEGNRLVASRPALAWMAYGIHGDEASGPDAALLLAHHLAAATDPEINELLDRLVVIIDPVMNPDGRERFISMLTQNRTVQPSVDDQSLLHTGVWPSGRMNHYLFDLNRDWIFATQPETRGRLRALAEWHPHYFMESHEMGPQDTFLFFPPREALNHNLPRHVLRWEAEFAQDQAAMFDAHGWRYYTGEWNDDWYPGYSSSWAGLRGSIANLYEQAHIATDAIRRPEGTLESYAESVHKQLASSLTNLRFLARNRQEILTDFLAAKRNCVGPEPPVPSRTFAILPSANATRQRRFLDLMLLQGFEVHRATTPFTAQGLDRLGRNTQPRELPAGTLLIPSRQPLAHLLTAMLEFDPRMSPQFLTNERRELLRFNRSLIYDVTGWSLPMLFDLETLSLSTDLPQEAQAQLVTTHDSPPDPITNPHTPLGFVVDGADDSSVAAAGRLMEGGVWVRVADKPFQLKGRDFSRGSLVILRKDNPELAITLHHLVHRVCGELQLGAITIQTGHGPGDLPDLGGEHFVLLEPPRIGVFGREPISPYSFGSVWHLIDHSLGLRASYLDAHFLQAADLRRYNVLVLPDGTGSESLQPILAPLKDWIHSGGTLIAIGSSAAALAKDQDGIGAVRLLPDVLTKLDDYRQAVVREWEARQTTPDPEQVWSFCPPAKVTYPWLIGEESQDLKEDDSKRRDAWRKLFMPAGALLASRVDDRNWLTAGCGDYLPVMFGGDTVLLAPPAVQAPLRLGVFSPSPPTRKDASTKAKTVKKKSKPDAESAAPGWKVAPPGFELRLRMSGLLWPEAADRLAHSAFVTRESLGAGQLVLFAADPTFRASAMGTARVLANAVVLGPGMGARHPIKP